MNHREIEQQDIIERYVRCQLKPEERREFQEHYFACDQCFENVQLAAKFIAGAQHAARAGVLTESATGARSEAAVLWWRSWLKPVFAMAVAACLLLVFALGWVVFKTLPGLQSQLAQERQSREAAEQQKNQSLQVAKEELEKERRQLAGERAEREKLQNQIARNQSPVETPVRPKSEAGTNVPVVILESTRDSKSGTQFKIPAQASAVTLWIEVEAGDRYTGFQLQILDAGGKIIKTITGLKANSYGALATSVSASQLPPGKYLVKLSGLKNGEKELVGDYNLTLQK